MEYCISIDIGLTKALLFFFGIFVYIDVEFIDEKVFQIVANVVAWNFIDIYVIIVRNVVGIIVELLCIILVDIIIGIFSLILLLML